MRELERFAAEANRLELPDYKLDMPIVSDAAWEEMTRNAPVELRDKLRAIGEQTKAMKEFARMLRDGEVVLRPTTWGGKRPGAGRPIGSRNRPNYAADKAAAVQMRKLLAK
jgi:hypothetical protein